MKNLAIMSLVLGLCRLQPVLAQARDPHEVQPERPTVATHAGTVAPGWIELEWGSEWDRYADHSSGTGVPVVAKVGLTSHAQLNVLQTAVQPPGDGSLHPGDVAVGVKWRLTDQARVLGRFAVLPSLKFPTGSDVLGSGTGTTDVGLLLISSHTLGAVGWVAELYGLPRTSGPAGQDAIVAALFGPTLVVRSWFSLDGGVIVPVTGPQPHAIYVGGVWNIGRVWKAARQ